jgi:DNA-binding response OmpR family regulator
MTAVCPCCGFDLALDEPVITGAMQFDPRGDVLWRGEKLNLTSSERIILGTLLKESPRHVSEAVLHERIDYEGDSHIAHVMICRLRKKLGDPNPIENDQGLGWRWAA